jgi:signal transduction histidine kinase
LLIMLVLLSLPLLVVSLLQINRYRQSVAEHERIIVQLGATTAANKLRLWLEERDGSAAPLSSDEIARLYATLRDQFPNNVEVSIAVIAPDGRPLNGASAPLQLAPVLSRQMWSDGIERTTSVRRLEPYGWSVAVGLPEYTRSTWTVLALMATWALALITSTMLAIWAVGRFTTPLSRLAQAVLTFGEGRFHERIAVETRDEVGLLAQSFNAMAASLEERFTELQHQRAFTEEVLNSLPLGVAVLDDALTIRSTNPTFARFINSSPANLIGHNLYEAARPFSLLRAAIEDVRRVRRPFINYSLKIRLDERAEQETFWDVILWPIRESVARADLILIISEVSDRVRAERLAHSAFAAERARAAELESVVNQMDEGVIIVDAQGAYRVNPKAARILALEPNERGESIWRLLNSLHLLTLDGKRLAPIETPLGRALERGEPVSDERLLFVTFAQEERIIDISATPLIGERGRHDGAVAVFRDVTEEVSHHRKLAEAYERLREHDRLKSAFVANVSHELRTPLNVIIGLCRLLERDSETPLSPLQHEIVERMERNARALLTQVNALLDYSRLEAGRAGLRLERVDVARLISSLVGDFAEEARAKGIELIAQVAPDLGMVTTDRDKLAQVIFNLLSNAIKFTRDGIVTIRAANGGEDSWYLEVSDTGIGIPEKTLPFIFEGFRQADDRLTRAYGGVGLGLAITHKIVQLLGGEIAVESRVGHGSRFRIVWPRTVAQRTGTGSLINGPQAANELAPGRQ